MATERQIEANRLNSQKSTGPKSPEGKAKSSANRLSHGFASNTTIIPGEDPDEFRGLIEDFLAEHQPATVTEQVLVEKMAHNQWLSLRAVRLQAEAFMDHMVNGGAGVVPAGFGLLIRYHTTAERAFHHAHNDLIKTKKQRTNSEIGFEPQSFGQEVHPVPPEEPKPAPVIGENGRPVFTAEEMDFPLCPEAIEFFKKRAA